MRLEYADSLGNGVKKNPKKVSIGDIMKFYKTESPYSNGCWTDQHDNQIPYDTCGVVIDFEWIDIPEYSGYEMKLLLPNGIVTEGWGEYAVEPVCKKIRTGKTWYRSANCYVKDV